MNTDFEKISKNNRYGYARVSSKEQAENSSLESQKAELIKLGVPEENIYLEIGSASDVIENRPIFFKLINQILKEGDLLAVTKLDRCSRNTSTSTQLSVIPTKAQEFNDMSLKFNQPKTSYNFVMSDQEAKRQVNDVPRCPENFT